MRCSVTRSPNVSPYFEDLGWRTLEVESLFVAAHRYRRLPMFMHPIGLAAADGSTAPGRQPLECGCTPYPLSSANG